MRRGKCHALNGTFRREDDPQWSLCGLAPWQVEDTANHYGPFGITCKTCIRLVKAIEKRESAA